MRRPSWYHVTTRSAFLAAALLAALVLWNFPNFLKLDAFRPQVLDVLQKTFGCKVILGNITGEVFPYPGLVVGHVVLLENSKTPRVLASANAVHLWLSAGTLKGRLEFRSIRFSRPRFYVHRQWGPQGEKQWAFLTLPTTTQPSQGSGSIQEWEVRNGTFEIWDHTTRPTSRWTATQVTGSFLMQPQTAALTAQIPNLGRHASLDLHYNGSAAFPVEGHLSGVELGALQSLTSLNVPSLAGMTSLALKVRLQPDLAFQVAMEPTRLPRLNDLHLRAHTSFEKNHFIAHLHTDRTPPMLVALEGDVSKNQWNARAAVTGYDSELVRELYDQTWVDRLEGPGTIDAQVQSSDSGDWSWSAAGKNFRLEGTSLRIPEWSARGDAQTLSVSAHATTAQGGTADVVWALPEASNVTTLQVDVVSVTLRQVLEVFNLQSRPSSTQAAKPEDSMNPYGYEPWLIAQGSMRALIHDDAAFEIQQSSFLVAGMPVNLRGTFDLTAIHPQAHIQGDVQNIAVPPVVESFFKPPSPVTGTGKMSFTLTFPMSGQWINGLTGPIKVEIDNGLVRELKTIYRIISVLNLGNYLRLRFPQVTARGIQFQTLSGDLLFQNGVLSADDLFLKGPNMNVGAKGSLDIPGKRLKITLRLEMFRFLEDILRDVPITHWIFKKPSKIFLPLVVVVDGPWSDVDVR